MRVFPKINQRHICTTWNFSFCGINPSHCTFKRWESANTIIHFPNVLGGSNLDNILPNPWLLSCGNSAFILSTIPSFSSSKRSPKRDKPIRCSSSADERIRGTTLLIFSSNLFWMFFYNFFYFHIMSILIWCLSALVTTIGERPPYSASSPHRISFQGDVPLYAPPTGPLPVRRVLPIASSSRCWG